MSRAKAVRTLCRRGRSPLLSQEHGAPGRRPRLSRRGRPDRPGLMPRGGLPTRLSSRPRMRVASALPAEPAVRPSSARPGPVLRWATVVVRCPAHQSAQVPSDRPRCGRASGRSRRSATAAAPMRLPRIRAAGVGSRPAPTGPPPDGVPSEPVVVRQQAAPRSPSPPEDSERSAPPGRRWVDAAESRPVREIEHGLLDVCRIALDQLRAGAG